MQIEILKEENEKLKSRWEELKKWIMSNDEHYAGAIPFKQTLRKMMEMEDNNEKNN